MPRALVPRWDKTGKNENPFVTTQVSVFYSFSSCIVGDGNFFFGCSAIESFQIEFPGGPWRSICRVVGNMLNNDKNNWNNIIFGLDRKSTQIYSYTFYIAIKVHHLNKFSSIPAACTTWSFNILPNKKKH